MIITRRFMVSLLLGSLALAPALAFAEQGRIAFSGRIVEATCDTSRSTVAAIDTSASHHMNCGSQAAGSSSTGYAASMTPLTGSASDRVLHYFETYVRAANPATANPLLLTKIYD